MVGGPAGLKDSGGQQSRFKWMMEGHSPAPSPPDSILHKNGTIPFFMTPTSLGYANKCEMSGTSLTVTESSCLVSLIYRSHCCSSQNERWFPIFPV